MREILDLRFALGADHVDRAVQRGKPVHAGLAAPHAAELLQQDAEAAIADARAIAARLSAGMTAAGVATLFVTQEFLNTNAGSECQGNVSAAAKRLGINRSTLYRRLGTPRG